jgi:hypothetical protein
MEAVGIEPSALMNTGNGPSLRKRLPSVYPVPRFWRAVFGSVGPIIMLSYCRIKRVIDQVTRNRSLTRKTVRMPARQIRREETMTESYQYILQMLRKRLPPMLSDQVDLNRLSISELLNLIFVLYGSWGSVGDFSTTFKAVKKLIGEEQLWQDPGPAPSVSELVQ